MRLVDTPLPLTKRGTMSDLDRPVALTIAGSDSGGGAGIQADIKTFQAFGVFGTSAVTAVTAQNTVGVTAVHLVPLDVVRTQITTVVQDLSPSAVKSGMLGTSELVETVADAIQEHSLTPYVLDPVMVASSGDRLLDENAVEAIIRRLLPKATLVTPNLEEARILTSLPISDEEGQRESARRLVQMGARAALVKGGHGSGTQVVDILWDGSDEYLWRHPRIETRNTHGTGCTLSAAITAGLSRGDQLVPAVEDALAFVKQAILRAPNLGRGHGPLSHFPIPDTEDHP